MRTLIAVFLTGSAVAQDSTLDIDATDLPRMLLHAEQTINVPPGSADELVLWYPKWVPGSHAPGGPVQNLAGLWITDPDGNDLEWRRTEGEAARIIVDLPDGTTAVNARFRYICNQSSSNSHGLDSFGAEALGLISPNTVLLYPESARASAWDVQTTLTVPEGWSAACALDVTAHDADTISYAPVSLSRLVDTPIMLGRHMTTYDLAADAPEGTPPHRMHVFSEIESETEIDDEVLEMYRGMVTQAAHMFGSFPFPSMDILVATTNQLRRNGLEHLRSTMNIIPLDRLDNPRNLKGWDQMLIPHEYVHAWCGKYKRPRAMATDDLHSPKGTDLLWVYEGLTQYLGELLEARSGMKTDEEYRWDLLTRIRWAKLQQGRDWRPLLDTAAASYTLRGGSNNWGHLRRSQDYYYEGALFWLEADALIRELSEGDRSLDDFVRAFMKADEPTDDPNPYDREDVVNALNAVVEHDWERFIADRIDTKGTRGPLGVARQVGYTIQYTNEPPEGPDDNKLSELDTRDGLGIQLASDGTIRSVMIGSAADKAGLAPRTKIMGIDGFTFSSARFTDALEASTIDGTLTLLTIAGDRIIETTIEYDQGPRFMTIVKDRNAPDPVEDIIRAR